MGRQVAELFDLDSKYCRNSHIESDVIDYNLLKKGESNETRFVLGKIIIDVLNDPDIEESSHIFPETENQMKNDQKSSHIFSEVVNRSDASGSGNKEEQKKHFKQRENGGNNMVLGSVQNNHREIFEEGKDETSISSKKKRIFSLHDDFKQVVETKFKRRKEGKIKQDITDIQLDIQMDGKTETNLRKKIEQENCEVSRDKKSLSKLFMSR